MRFLCVCQYGHCRSVCCARALQARGYEAVAVGAATAPSAIPVLENWADRVVVMEPGFAKAVSRKDKLVVFDVGPDRWANPYHPELRAIVDDLLDKAGWKHA